MKNNDHEIDRKSFFEAIAEGDEENCRRLWLSVMIQHYLDAIGKFGKGPIQDRALAWFEAREGINSGLYEVCYFASLDFDKTRRRFAELIKERSEVIDFRMLKRGKEENQTPQNRRRYYRRKDRNEKLRLRHQRKQAEEFLFRHADNDNLQDYANDNFPENINDSFINQPKEKN